MRVIRYKGKTYSVDEEGFLLNFYDWDSSWVDLIKNELGISKLTEKHWRIIKIIQQRYIEEGDVHGLRELANEAGVFTKDIYEMFSPAHPRDIYKMAGISGDVAKGRYS